MRRYGIGNKTMREHTADYLALARTGRFGTPEAPLRNGGDRHTFWACYFGHRTAREYRGTCSYPAARAGELYRKEIDREG